MHILKKILTERSSYESQALPETIKLEYEETERVCLGIKTSNVPKLMSDIFGYLLMEGSGSAVLDPLTGAFQEAAMVKNNDGTFTFVFTSVPWDDSQYRFPDA